MRKETEPLESLKNRDRGCSGADVLQGSTGERTKGIIECQMSRPRRHINGTGVNVIYTDLFGGSVHRQLNALRQSHRILFLMTLAVGVRLFLFSI